VLGLGLLASLRLLLGLGTIIDLLLLARLLLLLRSTAQSTVTSAATRHMASK
jgi:hypothetical protein